MADRVSQSVDSIELSTGASKEVVNEPVFYFVKKSNNAKTRQAAKTKQSSLTTEPYPVPAKWFLNNFFHAQCIFNEGRRENLDEWRRND